MADLIKWSQWSSAGMLRCGHAEMSKLMQWMRELGLEAKKCVKTQEKPHAVYGRKIYNKNDSVVEVRFYCEVYMTDEELEELICKEPQNVFYVAHQDGRFG